MQYKVEIRHRRTLIIDDTQKFVSTLIEIDRKLVRGWISGRLAIKTKAAHFEIIGPSSKSNQLLFGEQVKCCNARVVCDCCEVDTEAKLRNYISVRNGFSQVLDIYFDDSRRLFRELELKNLGRRLP